MLDYYGEINGKRVRLRESSGTDDEEKAKRLLRARVEGAHVAAKTGESVETAAHRRYTVAEALEDYLADLRLREKKSAAGEEYRLGEDSVLRQELGHLRVKELTRDRLVEYAERRRSAGKSNKTINNDLTGLMSALRLAQKAGRVFRIPPFPSKLRERVRTGFPDPSEPEALAKEAPGWLAEMIRFAYATGWRRGELFALRWEWVDWEEREIRLPDSKNGEGRVVPIAGELVAIMERLKGARRVTRADGSVALAETVFHADGQQITKKRFTNAWTATRKEAKLPHRLFHDFRRAAARRLTNAGVPQSIAMRVTGHVTPSMYRRYSIVETSDMARGLERVAAREEGAKVRRIGHRDGHR
jgi:integrase